MMNEDWQPGKGWMGWADFHGVSIAEQRRQIMALPDVDRRAVANASDSAICWLWEKAQHATIVSLAPRNVLNWLYDKAKTQKTKGIKFESQFVLDKLPRAKSLFSGVLKKKR